MNPLSGNCSNLHRLVIEHWRTTSTAVLTTFLPLTCLAALITFLNFACSSPAPTPPPTHYCTPTPMVTDTPLPSVAPTPILPSLVSLEKPEDDYCMECGTELTLWWDCVRKLLGDEYYRLKVWVEGHDPSVFYQKGKSLALPALAPGEYKWAVAVVRSMGSDAYEQVSEESERRHFHVLPPAPAVHSISPTSTLKDKAETVIVSGENFTAPVTLTVGSPLQATLLDSGTIMAIIPTTLRVGVYTVTVQDSMGRGVSSTVFFTVAEPPTPTPAVPPTRVPPTRTPPPALPGITLISPISNVHVGRSAEMTWEWPGSWQALGPDAVFAIRWGLASEGELHSQVWCTVIQRPGESWCPDKKWLVDFTDCDDLGERAMVWNVALALADWEARSYRQVLVQSELAYFRVQTNINDCPP